MTKAQDLLERLLTTGAYFKPENRVESARVQRMLMALGFVWCDGDTSICEHDACTTRGLSASNGSLGLVREADSGRIRYDSCKTLLSLEIEDVMGASSLPLMQAFRLVTERQRVIEDRLERVLAILEPKVIGKPAPIRKSGGATP